MKVEKNQGRAHHGTSIPTLAYYRIPCVCWIPGITTAFYQTYSCSNYKESHLNYSSHDNAIRGRRGVSWVNDSPLIIITNEPIKTWTEMNWESSCSNILVLDKNVQRKKALKNNATKHTWHYMQLSLMDDPGQRQISLRGEGQSENVGKGRKRL